MAFFFAIKGSFLGAFCFGAPIFHAWEVVQMGGKLDTQAADNQRKKSADVQAELESKYSAEVVSLIPLSEQHPFKGYGSMPRQPYQVRDDDPVMQQITATVRERGIR